MIEVVGGGSGWLGGGIDAHGQSMYDIKGEKGNDKNHAAVRLRNTVRLLVVKELGTAQRQAYKFPIPPISLPQKEKNKKKLATMSYSIPSLQKSFKLFFTSRHVTSLSFFLKQQRLMFLPYARNFSDAHLEGEVELHGHQERSFPEQLHARVLLAMGFVGVKGVQQGVG